MEVRARLVAPAVRVRQVDPDAAMVAAARAEPRMFLGLYDRYFERVLGYVRLRIRDEATCEDVTSTVFTTALAQGERYADVLAEHRRALREAFSRHGGVEVDTKGDAFFVAFARAGDAVAAAHDAQAALVDGPVSVRMGLHTGEPVVTEEGYVGIDVADAMRAVCRIRKNEFAIPRRAEMRSAIHE